MADLVELFELTGAALLQVDPQTLCVVPLGNAGRALLSAAGLHAGDALETAIPPDEREAVRSVLAAARDGQARIVEHRLRVVGGAERRFRTTLRCGEKDVVAVLLDITAAHHNERQWREVESWLATLAEALPFDFWVCDAEGRCVLQNPASAERVGNLLGLRADRALKPEASRTHFAAAVPRVLRGERVREELQYEVGDELRTFSRVVAPVSDGSKVSGVLGLDIDITQIKQAQDSLLRRQRLAELGVMAAVVAHEVRNPLGSISNAIALVRRQVELSNEGRVLCRIIEDEIQRLDEMVVSLLDFARPMRVTFEERALWGIIDEALAQALRADASSGRIRVLKKIDETLEPLSVDSRLLNLALTNLFRNALKAMSGDGELHITVDREVGAEGAWARVGIRDTGPGISAEAKERLFEPFFTTRSTGSGLGLTIVKRAIDAHRGQIDFISDDEHGTTCVIKLPLSGPAA
nr:adaptive-response sensory-kinase SasA [uncultured bacterium]